ncbi:MAG: DUF1699 family protein [Candidatus Hydrothermarchaeota archaeon]
MKIVLNPRNTEELIRMIKEIDPETEEIHMSIRPTVETVAEILRHAPRLKRLSCPPSLYERASPKIKFALEKKNIDFFPKKERAGRPLSYPKKKIERVYELFESGVPPKEISKREEMPITTVYYYLRKKEFKKD